MVTVNITICGHVSWDKVVTAIHLHMNAVTSGHTNCNSHRLQHFNLTQLILIRNKT